jgi:hypothetical protein
VIYRALISLVAWALGPAFVFTDARPLYGVLIMAVCGVVGCLPWIPLARGKARGSQKAALAILAIGGALTLWFAANLPGAYRTQAELQKSLETSGGSSAVKAKARESH